MVPEEREQPAQSPGGTRTPTLPNEVRPYPGVGFGYGGATGLARFMPGLRA